MKTVKDAFALFKNSLNTLYSTQEAESIISLLLEDLTGLNKAKLRAFSDTQLSTNQIEQLTRALAELQSGKPIQYILGHTDFYGHTFKVGPSVLIPRPETEELVDWIAKTTRNHPTIKILDIGTGSGCIAISLKLININNEVFALDISSKALEVAMQNAKDLNAPVTFINGDILNAEQLKISSSKFNAIVSNPPYVTGTDKMQMHKNVTDFEPDTALFVPDANPLLFYVAIANFATKNLENGGYLFFEINESFGSETVEMLVNAGFDDVELRRDMSGKDRMIKCVWVA